MADLLTLNELKAMLNIDPTDTRKDAMYSAVIPPASDAIRAWTERDFGAAMVTEMREFDYDGSGYLDIDDAAAITEVAFTVPHGTDIVLDADEWRAQPSRRDDSPVFWYVYMPGRVGPVAASPEMGFARNMDVYAAEGRYTSIPSIAKVTGQWGWPDVPGAVKLATVWTIVDWTSKPDAENLTSEAIAGYARSWGRNSAGGLTQAMAIPNKARDILAQYQKQRV